MHLQKITLAHGGKEEVVPLTGEPIEIGGGMASIYPSSGGYWINSYVPIYLNSRSFEGSEQLQHNTVIRLPGELYTFKDDASQEAWRKKIAAVMDYEESALSYTAEEIATLKKRIWDIFWCGGKYGASLVSIAEHAVFYARTQFRWERAIFYRIEGEEGVGIAAQCPEPVYKTPNALLFEVFRRKGPVPFRLKQTANPSLSIIENRITIAFGAPIMVAGEPVAILYVDSSGPAHSLGMLGLAHICLNLAPEIGEIINEEMIDVPDLKEVNL